MDAPIGLLGDPHVDLLWTGRATGRLAARGVKQVHVLGDCGFVWHGAAEERRHLAWLEDVLATQRARLLITGANHEGYDALERQFPMDTLCYRSLTERIVWLPHGWRASTATARLSRCALNSDQLELVDV